MLQSVTALRLAFDGVNLTPKVTATDQQPGIKNYFIGNRPEKWHTHVPIFGKVAYRNLYPGIDLVFYGGKSGLLEYDLNVSPGADPNQVRFRFEGADRVELADGDLLIHAGPAELRQPSPHVYSATVPRRAIPVSYRMDDHGWIGLDLSKRDARDGLRIDPVLAYSTYLGGSGAGDLSESMTVDIAGSIYVTGAATSIDFPTTDAGYQQTDPTEVNNGASTVTKLDPTGSFLVYSTYVGGTLVANGVGDLASQIVVTDGGFAYFVGQTESADFPVTPGAAQPSFGGAESDGYVVELAPAGDRLIYSTFLGGPDIDAVYALDLDGQGNAYVGGLCFGSQFPTSNNALQRNYGGGGNGNGIFAKLNPDGTQFLYKSYFGGSGSGSYVESVNSIKVDANQQLILAGYSASSDAPGHELSPVPFHDGGGGDIFLTKLVDDGGGELSPVFFTYLGGSGLDYEWDLKVDPLGNTWMVGHTGSADFPVTPDAFQSTLISPPTNDGSGPFDAFIAILDPVGTVLHATFLGGNGDDRALALALDSKGHAHILGFTASTDLPTKDPLHGEHDEVLPEHQHDGGDLFLADFTVDGGLDFLSYIGGSGSEGFFNPSSSTIALDSLGATYFVGSSTSTDFPVTEHAFQKKNNAPPGGTNMVVVKVMPTPPPATLISIQPNSGPYTGSSAVKVQGNNMSAQCEVDFGGVPSIILIASPNQLQVNVQPHVCGAFDVTLSCIGSPPSVLPDGFTFVGCPDSGPPDAGTPDAGPTLDAGPPVTSSSGCGCGSTGATLAAGWVLGLVLLAMGRRRRQRRTS